MEVDEKLFDEKTRATKDRLEVEVMKLLFQLLARGDVAAASPLLDLIEKRSNAV